MSTNPPSIHETLLQFDNAVSPLPILGRAIDGAIFGAAVGFLVNRKEGSAHRQIGRHAIMGASIGAALGIVSYMFGKGVLTTGHMLAEVIDVPDPNRAMPPHVHAPPAYYAPPPPAGYYPPTW